MEQNDTESVTAPDVRQAQIDVILNNNPVDLAALRTISRQVGGFLSSENRIKIWPKLVGYNRFNIINYVNFVNAHEDDAQVRCDVDRQVGRRG